MLITLGALHTEKMLWQMSGDFQDGSGIVTAFANSGIVTVGTASSFMICLNITKTRYHKQVLVLALEVLKLCIPRLSSRTRRTITYPFVSKP